MKNFLFILVLLLIGYLIWSEFYREYQPPEGWLLVSEADWDSLKTIKPDTIVVKDTIFPPPDTIWLTEKVPIAEPYDDVNYYEDVHETAHMNLFINDSIRGELLHRQVGYELFVPEKIIHTVKITKLQPVPVRVYQPTPITPYQYYITGGLGIGGYSLEGGIIRNEKWMVGLQGMRVVGNEYALIKIGVQF